MSRFWDADRGTSFAEVLKEQRWDDHRYYHHSRINQTLHLLSACSFVAAIFFLLAGHAAIAALLGWFVGMCSRQSGHFFFEPRGYDEVNHATDEHKEAIKVGYNIRRKIVLMSVWALTPFVLLLDPTFFGMFAPHHSLGDFVEHTAVLWLWIGLFAALFRTVQLFFIRDVQTGLAWFVKIATDPFHDIWLYHKAPLALMRGELIAPASENSQPAQQG